MGYWRSLLMESRFITSRSDRFKVVSTIHYLKCTFPCNCLFYYKRLALNFCSV